MANELTWDTVTGLTINVYRFKTDDNVFLANPATDEVWGTGGRTAADYAIAMSESGSSGHYSVDFNDGGAIAAGVYNLVYAIQAGASPANSDRKIAKAQINWDGSAEITPSVIDTVVDTIAGDVVNIDGIVPAAAGDLTTAQNDLDTITGGSGVLIDTDAVDADAIKADAVTAIQSGLATSTNITDAHTATDADISTVDGKVDIIAIDVAGLDGEAMRGTDFAITSLDPITTDKDSYKATSVAVSDKTGFSLSTAGILAIWHQALTSITSVGSVGKKLKDWVVGQITGTDDIDFSATQKTSLNAATPDLSAITSDKDSYKATGFNIVTPDVAGTAAGLHSTTNDKIDALNNITVADILAGVIEGTITLQQSLRGLMATEFGKASGGDTTSIKFRNLADTKNRITETVDSNGNRTSVTLDLT